MKKQISLCGVLFFTIAVSAQHAVPSLFRPKKNTVKAQSSSRFKSGNSIKPLKGVNSFSFSEEGQLFQDSVQMDFTYFPSGKIESTALTEFGSSNVPYAKNVFSYDVKDYTDVVKSYQWNGSDFDLSYEYGVVKTYDAGGLLLSALDFEVQNGDTAYQMNYTTSYSGDTLVLKGVLAGEGAPNDEVLVYKFFKTNGATNYSDAIIKEWNSATYDSYTLAKMDWHNEFALERLIYLEPNDQLFDYVESTDGVDVYRTTGTFTPSRGIQLYEVKQGLIFVPQFRETIDRDSHGNVELVNVETGYNVVTGNYDSYYTDKIINVYDQDNLVMETYQYKSDVTPEYTNRYRIRYSGFADKSGVSEAITNPVKVYPNPTSDWAHIEGSSRIDQVVLTDLQGKPVEVSTEICGEKAQVNTAGLAGGVYFCTVLSATNSTLIRIQVIR